jgi:hypothetical protein
MNKLEAKRGTVGIGLVLLVVGGLFLIGQILTFANIIMMFWITVLLGPIPVIFVVVGLVFLFNNNETLVWVDDNNLTVVKTNQTIPLTQIKTAVIRKHGYFMHGLASAWLESIDLHLTNNIIVSVKYIKDATVFVQQLNSLIEKSK